jgi:hypothetical protein
LQLAVECADNLKVYINAYEIDFICSPLSNQSIDVAIHDYPHLQGLVLANADPNPERDGENLEVDLMIGADHYWSFVQNHVVRGESGSGPVAVVPKRAPKFKVRVRCSI